MAAAIKAVGGRPFLKGFLPIKPNQPYAATIALLPAKVVGEFEQQASGGTAVVGANVVLEWIVGFVMRANDQDAVFCPGIFRNDVVERESTGWSLGLECIIFDSVALEMVLDVILYLLVRGGSRGPRPDGNDLLHILHGTVCIDGWGGSLRHSGLRRLRGLRRRHSFRFRRRLILRAAAGQQQKYQPACGSQPHALVFASRALRRFGCTTQATPMLNR